jgi:hypothetical protein
MAVTETSRTGFLGNVGKSIMAIPIGILLFLGSFAVLFMNEGRTDWSKVAADSVEIAATDASASGEFVSVTGTLGTSETIGDPQFLNAGSYILLDRTAEMFAWEENSETTSRNNTGGSTTRTTTYTYATDWTSNPPNSSNFREQGHDNPPMNLRSEEFAVNQASIGSITFDASAPQRMPSATDLDLDQSMISTGLVNATLRGGYIYLDGANPGSPVVGDMRVSFDALVPGGNVTAFGSASNGVLATATTKEGPMFRVFNGDRATSLATMKSEYKMMGWIFRVVGFLMMWFGMSMVFAPLHAIAGILPFLKKGTTFLVNLITFPIALVLTTITVVVSMILNSLIAIIVTTLIFGGIIAFLFTMRKKVGGGGAASAGMPPGPPPPGMMPPGPPPA